MLYPETVLLPKFDEYRLAPSGVTAMPVGPEPNVGNGEPATGVSEPLAAAV
jgi:hypothetical protein